MYADIIARDASGRDILIAVVKARLLGAELIAEYFALMERECPSVPYAMYVDVEEIRIVRQGEGDFPGTACILNTPEILRHYDSEFGSSRIRGHFLQTLVDAWLRDLSYVWKREKLPGSDELSSIGLLERLKGGTTEREVAIGADAVR